MEGTHFKERRDIIKSVQLKREKKKLTIEEKLKRYQFNIPLIIDTKEEKHD